MYAAPSSGEALQQLRKGEKAVLRVPPGQGTPETLVYEVEVVDIKSPAAIADRTTDKKEGQLDGANTQQPMSAQQSVTSGSSQQTTTQPATNSQLTTTGSQG